MATNLSDANISGLIDLIPTPFLVQDGETVLYANRQSVSLYGYNSIDEFVGTPVIDLVHPDDRETFLARRDRILEGSEASLGIIEQRRIRADGSEIYVLSRGVRGTWQGRKCILGIQIDITERKAAERALALTKERFGIVFDTATVGMIMLDDEGSCVLANANSAHLLGEDSPDGLIGESVDKLFRGRTVGTNPADIATLLVRAMTAREKFEIVDVALNRSDGSSFDGAIRLLPMSLENRPYGYFVVFCDISERRRIKAEVERREEEIRALHNQLTRSSQRTAMENLSSVIAHELGQPLSAIVNAAGALRRTAEAADESSPPDERISFIQEQADRASAIIGGMRRVFGPGHQDFAVESIDGIVADVCAVSGVELNRRKISLEIETAERLPEIRVNRIQIQQVVYNLLRNAAEALSDTPKPEIRVQTSAIEDGGILIRIQDNGPGVDIDMLPRLFEPFQTSKSEGMGMGLYTCRTIIEAHGGTITPLSEPGRGTAFEIRLPAKP